MDKTFTRLALSGFLLALIVVSLGAYTRLKDAGLGCPDWPGCYGQISVPGSLSESDTEKAWAEMIHRYAAGTLGILVFTLTVFSWKNRGRRFLSTLLAGLVIFQALLGMWTVTLKLFPTVVMGHLLGGFTTLTLLGLLSLPATPALAQPERSVKRLAWIALWVLVLQIALGGWTAANYAAAVCTELPICQSGWPQALNFQKALQFWGHGHAHYEFAPHIGADAKITIHVMHRVGAMMTFTIITLLAFLLWKQSTSVLRYFAAVLAGLVSLQCLLGVGNIVLSLPLPIAVAHNTTAALLLATLAALNYFLFKSDPLPGSP